MAQINEKYILIKIKKKDKESAQKAKGKKDDSQGISNPRYYENGLSHKRAEIKRELGKVDGFRFF